VAYEIARCWSLNLLPVVHLNQKPHIYRRWNHRPGLLVDW